MFKLISMLLVGLVLVQLSCGSKEPQSKKGAVAAGNAAPSGKDSLTVELLGKDSVSVLQLLKGTHQVKEIVTAAGTFVAGIDSINAQTNLFWIYSVNDTNPDVACDKFITHNGDRVVWHLRKM